MPSLGVRIGIAMLSLGACVTYRATQDESAQQSTRHPPDRDGDGVPDDKDACPDLPGVPDPDPKKNGCPTDRYGDSTTPVAERAASARPAPDLPPPPDVSATPAGDDDLASRHFTGYTCTPRGKTEYVESVFPGGPAERAGLRAGDYVVSIGGLPAWPDGLRASHTRAIGDSETLVYVRGGKRKTTQITIGSAAALTSLCDGGNAMACMQRDALRRTPKGQVASFTSLGSAPLQVTSQMIQQLAEQCSTKNAQSCLAVGLVLENGLGVDPDPGRAQGYIKSACGLGLPTACQVLVPDDVTSAASAP